MHKWHTHLQHKLLITTWRSDDYDNVYFTGTQLEELVAKEPPNATASMFGFLCVCEKGVCFFVRSSLSTSEKSTECVCVCCFVQKEQVPVLSVMFV